MRREVHVDDFGGEDFPEEVENENNNEEIF
jgi:hypothetical protein